METRYLHLILEIPSLSSYSSIYTLTSLLISLFSALGLYAPGPILDSQPPAMVRRSSGHKISIDLQCHPALPLRPSSFIYFNSVLWYWQILFAFFSNVQLNLYSVVYFTLFAVISPFSENTSEPVFKCIFYLVYCYFPEIHKNRFSKKREQFSGL